MGTRLQWTGVVALVATLALIAAQFVARAGGDELDGLVVIPAYATGERPAIDGGDVRPRFEVQIDGAELVAATATAVGGADALSRSDRALVDLLDSDTDADLAPFAMADRAAASDVAPDDATPEAVAQALTLLDPAVDEATHVVGDTYEVVGNGLSVASLLEVAGVLGVEVGTLSWPTADTYLDRQWGLENTGDVIAGRRGTVGLDVGWAEASSVATGAGIVVAVIDSGVDFDHPDLAGTAWQNPGEVCGNGVDDDGNGRVDDCNGWDFARGDGSVNDAGADNRHGTHVAGTIVARTDNGIGVASLAPDAQIMSLKVFDGGSAPSTRIAAGVVYAVENGADIINMSLGGDQPSGAMVEALTLARDNGVLVVAAAGNDGRDIDVRPTYPASYDLDNIVTVGSHANDGSISSFSNHGRTSVDLFAPGEQIAATLPNGGYGYMSGTSMAAPMVTAVAAVTAASHRTTDAAFLRSQLLGSVVTDAIYAPRSVTGGRVSAPGALGAPVVPLGDLNATFAGLSGLAPGAVRSTVTAALPGAVDAGVEIDLALVRWHEDALHAVLEHPVTVSVAGDPVAGASGAGGRLPVGALTDGARADLGDGGLSIVVETELPEGRYALVLGASTADGNRVAPQVAAFVVGDPAALPTPAPGTGGGGGTTPAPGTGGGTTPAPGTGGGTTPAPGTGGGTTPAPGTGGGGGTTPAPGTGGGTTPAPGTGGGTTPAPGTGGGTTPAPGTGGGGGTTPAPGTGGGTTPAPGTGGGGGTTPAPGTGTTPAPGTGGDSPGPVVDGVSPDSGPTSGGTRVSIGGDYQQGGLYYVFLGETVFATVAPNSWQLVVETRRVMTAGPRDVEVMTIYGAPVADYPGAFTYVTATSGGGGGGGTTPTPGTGGTPVPPAPGTGGGSTPAPGSGGTTPPGGGGGSTPPPGTGGGTTPTPGTGGGGTTPTPGTGGGGTTPAPSTGATTRLADGMLVERISSGPLLALTAGTWSANACQSDPCPGVRLD